MAELLLVDWPEPEALASAIIDRLDEVRTSKLSYVGVMQFGQHSPFYAGVGPYPGRKSAENGLLAHPAIGSTTGHAIVPMRSARGLVDLIREVDAPPGLTGDWAVVKEDAALFKAGWNGREAERGKWVKAVNG